MGLRRAKHWSTFCIWMLTRNPLRQFEQCWWLEFQTVQFHGNTPGEIVWITSPRGHCFASRIRDNARSSFQTTTWSQRGSYNCGFVALFLLLIKQDAPSLSFHSSCSDQNYVACGSSKGYQSCETKTRLSSHTERHEVRCCANKALRGFTRSKNKQSRSVWA